MTGREAGWGEDVGLRVPACLIVSRPHILYLLSSTEMNQAFLKGEVVSVMPSGRPKGSLPLHPPALPALWWGLSEPEGIARPRADLKCFIVILEYVQNTACLR